MKTDMDYLNYTDLNEVEVRISNVTSRIQQDYIPDMPPYTSKTWALNELPYIQEIDRIERGIKSIGYNFYEPEGWITVKEWITSDNLYPIKSFDYRDYNRWLTDLELIENAQGELLTLWNGTSQIEWNLASDEEWIDASTYIVHEVIYDNDNVLYNDEQVRFIERD